MPQPRGQVVESMALWDRWSSLHLNRALPATLFEWNAKNVVVMWCLVMSHCAVTAAPDCHFGTAVIEHTLVTSPLRGGARDLEALPYAFLKTLSCSLQSTWVSNLQLSNARWPMWHASPPNSNCRMPLA